MGLFSSVLSAGVGLIGNLIAGNQAKKSQDRQNSYNQQMSQLEYERQKEFAQNGIRWRVDDAKAAGLHPLAALGNTGISYSNTAFPSAADGIDYNALGQNIGRMLEAGLTSVERATQRAQLTNMQLQNDLLATQVASSQLAVREQAAQSQPIPTGGYSGGMFIPGQGSQKLLELKPAEIIAASGSSPVERASVAGANPGIAWEWNADNSIMPWPSAGGNSAKEDFISESLLERIPWYIANRFSYVEPPRSLLPKGAVDWHLWNAANNSWRPVYPEDISSNRYGPLIGKRGSIRKAPFVWSYPKTKK